MSTPPSASKAVSRTNPPTARRRGAVPSRGLHANMGAGLTLQPIEIGHPRYVGVIEPDTAFWALVERPRLADAFDSTGSFLRAARRVAPDCARDMRTLRFDLKPSAVYFNITARCNLNCGYCYLPAETRRNGEHMPAARVTEALQRLRAYFRRTLPKGRRPQIVFHGAEPLMHREALFAALDRFADDFQFGVQTNGTLLDEEAIRFLTAREVSIGLSLDGPTPATADSARRTWAGDGVSGKVVQAIERLQGYAHFNVICTIAAHNVRRLPEIVDYFHGLRVPACLLNVVRCTLPAARPLKPDDPLAARYFLAALERSYALYRRTGRKLVIANFANILLAILAPAARRLMCDISPCGGGRCFFALAPNGDLFPCSEFIGLPAFNGGNLFRDDLDAVLAGPAFRRVTERRIEAIEPCHRCAIRHFCGAPCPAEAQEMNGGMTQRGAFCEFYEEQTRYAFRLIANGRENAFLWDDWARDTRSLYQL